VLARWAREEVLACAESLERSDVHHDLSGRGHSLRDPAHSATPCDGRWLVRPIPEVTDASPKRIFSHAAGERHRNDQCAKVHRRAVQCAMDVAMVMGCAQPGCRRRLMPAVRQPVACAFELSSAPQSTQFNQVSEVSPGRGRRRASEVMYLPAERPPANRRRRAHQPRECLFLTRVELATQAVQRRVLANRKSRP